MNTSILNNKFDRKELKSCEIFYPKQQVKGTEN